MQLRWSVVLAAVVLWGCGEPPAREAAEAAAPRSGEQVYQRACAACHVPGRFGAPRSVAGFRDHWLMRLEQVGFAGLLAITEQGQRRMPPKGNCFDCSDQELSDALVHFLKAGGVSNQELDGPATDGSGDQQPDS